MVLFGWKVWDAGNGIYYYTYTQNILFFIEGMKGTQLNHVWSLAVEEQFYLFWPWLVIFISNRKLLWALLVVIPLTILFKTYSGIEGVKMLTIAHFDTLGGGALIALLIHDKMDFVVLQINKIKGLVILVCLLLLAISYNYLLPNVFVVLAILLLSLSLLIGCYYNFNGILGRILNIPFLKYLGKISYGLYLYHKPVPYLIKNFIFKFEIHGNSIVLFLISITITIVLAILSFRLIESPFLRLKEKFDL